MSLSLLSAASGSRRVARTTWDTESTWIEAIACSGLGIQTIKKALVQRASLHQRLSYGLGPLDVTIQRRLNARAQSTKGAGELNLFPWSMGVTGWCAGFSLQRMAISLSRLRVITPFRLCVESLLLSYGLDYPMGNGSTRGLKPNA